MTLNKIIISFFLTVIITQILKATVYSCKNKGFKARYLLASAGMPSCHTSAVVSLSYGIYLTEGFTSVFVVALLFSLIIIRDILFDKRFIDEIEKGINQLLHHNGFKHKKILPEDILGHTLTEVIAGLIVGLIITKIVFLF